MDLTSVAVSSFFIAARPMLYDAIVTNQRNFMEIRHIHLANHS